MPPRLVIGLALATGLSLATLDRPAVAEVGLALGHLSVVAVASWSFSPAGQWATVLLAGATWTAAKLDVPGLRVGLHWGLDWSQGVPAGILWDAGLRLGALASAAVTTRGLRQAVRRLLRTEDALAVTLLRERDSARRDRLTRLWNARYLHEALEQEVARCRRYGRPFGLLVVDLDGFKAVNDTAGHEAGDAVLQVVGRAIRDNCRVTDIPARLGGDEFAIILPEASSLTVPRYAQKLVELIAAAPFPPGLPPVSASIGAVAFARAPESAKTALAVADEAMYAAKRDGKNRFAMAAPSRLP